MNTYRKAGGFAALAHAFAYLAGIVIALILVFPVLDSGNTLLYFDFVKNNQWLLSIWILICYWGSAISVVILALALYRYMNNSSSFLIQIATVFGIIWAGLIIVSANLMLNDFRVITRLYLEDPVFAVSAWTILEAVENGIVSGNELVGSLWVSLLSVAALHRNKLPKALNYLGVTLGLVGLCTLTPDILLFPAAAFAFGIGMMIWSIGLGIALLKIKPVSVASERGFK